MPTWSTKTTTEPEPLPDLLGSSHIQEEGFTENDYQELRKRYLEPRDSDPDMPGGMRLRAKNGAKPPLIDSEGQGWRELKQRIKQLEREQNNAEIYYLLHQLRNWEMYRFRFPIVTGRRVRGKDKADDDNDDDDDDQVLEIYDLTGEDDDKDIIDVDTYIVEVLLVKIVKADPDQSPQHKQDATETMTTDKDYSEWPSLKRVKLEVENCESSKRKLQASASSPWSSPKRCTGTNSPIPPKEKIQRQESEAKASKPSLEDFFEGAAGTSISGEMCGEMVSDDTFQKLEQALDEFPELAFEKGYAKCTALHHALFAQPPPDLGLVEKLVRLNPSALKETTDHGWNALHLALKEWAPCESDVVQFLAEARPEMCLKHAKDIFTHLRAVPLLFCQCSDDVRNLAKVQPEAITSAISTIATTSDLFYFDEKNHIEELIDLGLHFEKEAGKAILTAMVSEDEYDLKAPKVTLLEYVMNADYSKPFVDYLVRCVYLCQKMEDETNKTTLQCLWSLKFDRPGVNISLIKRYAAMFPKEAPAADEILALLEVLPLEAFIHRGTEVDGSHEDLQSQASNVSARGL